MKRIFASLVLISASVLFSPRTASAATIAWVPVGNPGNPADPSTGSGSVAYNYRIDKYDVTASQYVEFLNAKDPTGANPLHLYNTGMFYATYGGIAFSDGAASGSKYSVIAGRGNHPVNYVNWYDAIRFANWLNNGQGNGDTETGAYTLGPLGADAEPINGLDIKRNPGATVFLPSADEWYKAAYYNPASSSYFQYPTRSNAEPIPSAPTALPNHANFTGGPANVTDVGAYTGTMSPSRAFDMGGNVIQWTESLFQINLRRWYGGDFQHPGFLLKSDYNDGGRPFINRFEDIGFRVAGLPEPNAEALLGMGIVGALGSRRRKGM